MERRLSVLRNHLQPVFKRKDDIAIDIQNTASMALEDEFDLLVDQVQKQQQQQQQQPLQSFSAEQQKYVPYLIVPSFVEESARVGQQKRERRNKRIQILYDVQSNRAQIPSYLDVSQDDPKTPLAFRYIRIILLTADARRAQDIHLDQHSSRAMSVVFATQLGVTGRIVIKGLVVQSIIYYLAFYDQLLQQQQQQKSGGGGAATKLDFAVRDYKLMIKVRTHNFLTGIYNVYRVNCIRTNHELNFYHIVMRVLQN